MPSTSASTARSRAWVAWRRPADPLELAAGVGAQLAEGVELARQLGEVVVELGKLLDLDALHGDGDVGLLAGGLAARELAGEGRRLAGRHAGERLVQALEHRPAADLVRQAARLRVLDRLAVHRRGQVDGRVVAVLRRALRGLERGEPLAQRRQVLLHVVRRDRGGLHGDRQLGEVGQLELRPDLDLGRERQVLAVVELGHLDVRLAEGEHLGLLYGLAVELGQRLVDRLGQHGGAAHPHVNDLRRNPARAEPWDAHLPRHLAVSLVEARLEFLESNFDAQPDTGRAQLFDGGLHGGVTPETWTVTARWAQSKVYGG